MRVQVLGHPPYTVEVKEQEDGSLTDEAGNTYSYAHRSGDFHFVNKIEATIDSVEEKVEETIETVEEKVEDLVNEAEDAIGSAEDAVAGYADGVEPVEVSDSETGEPITEEETSSDETPEAPAE